MSREEKGTNHRLQRGLTSLDCDPKDSARRASSSRTLCPRETHLPIRLPPSSLHRLKKSVDAPPSRWYLLPPLYFLLRQSRGREKQ